ncbi:GAF domain-containing sensor histidine kinase [Kouleothrix sp.]|uniref:sensor histidine kinase n=1 Tax=Kouleothrix sp. TaxID=2779161 RepID=UPI00391D98F3
MATPTHTRRLAEAFTRPPNLEDIDVGRLVMWAGFLSSALPSALLLTLSLLSGRLALRPALYTLLVLAYLALLLLIDIRSALSLWIWRRLWAFLLLLSLVCLAIQSQMRESFLQPLIFILPLIYAALAYPAGRVLLTGLWLLGMMNLGIWLSGEHELIAFLFPTFGYGTFMTFTYAFVHLSLQQAAARRRASRLAHDLAQQRDYLAQLAEITATLTRDLDLATVLEQVAAAGRALARASQARVWLRDLPDDDDLSLAAAVPSQPDHPALTASELWGQATLANMAPIVSERGLVLPLVSKGSTIGALELRDRPESPFADADARLLQPFANAAAVAIENARLYDQARLSATLAERNRLARELHDTIAQGLTAVTMQLEAAQRGFDRDPARARARITRAHELARESLEDVRRSVWTLAAPLVDGAELGQALADLAARFAERSGLAASYSHTGAAPRLGHAAATQVLRVVQEALQNVEKHAHASVVSVASDVEGGALRVAVRDDGAGFAPGELARPNGSGGFGLLSLRERARLAGGTLRVESAPGAGTIVELTIPLPAPPKAESV